MPLNQGHSCSSRIRGSECQICQAQVQQAQVQEEERCLIRGADLEGLGGSLTHRSYELGETVFSQGDPCRGIYSVSSGLLGLRKIDARGNAVLLQLVYSGAALGFESLLGTAEHEVSLEALSPAVVCFVPREAVTSLARRDPEIGLRFLRRASRELARAQETILEAATLSNRHRLVQLLLVLLDRHGKRNADGSAYLDLPISRRDLASMIGARQETLSRIIARLEADGLALFDGRRVHLPSASALFRDLSGTVPLSLSAAAARTGPQSRLGFRAGELA